MVYSICRNPPVQYNVTWINQDLLPNFLQPNTVRSLHESDLRREDLLDGVVRGMEPSQQGRGGAASREDQSRPRVTAQDAAQQVTFQDPLESEAKSRPHLWDNIRNQP